MAILKKGENSKVENEGKVFDVKNVEEGFSKGQLKEYLNEFFSHLNYPLSFAIIAMLSGVFCAVAFSEKMKPYDIVLLITTIAAGSLSVCTGLAKKKSKK
jgi:hypothetical protein